MATEPDPPDTFDAVAAADDIGELPTDGDDSDFEENLELRRAIALKDKELARANQRADQAHAEVEAAGKRLAAASKKELERRTRDVLAAFLPVLDDLDRAVAAARQHAESADVVEGLTLVRRSLLQRLGQFGVEHAPALGEVFDPQRHEAIALVAVTDPAKDGRVLDVTREGYVVGGDTLRAAGVAVGKLSK